MAMVWHYTVKMFTMHTVKIESYIKQTFLSYGFSHQKKSNLTNDIVVMFKTMVISTDTEANVGQDVEPTL